MIWKRGSRPMTHSPAWGTSRIGTAAWSQTRGDAFGFLGAPVGEPHAAHTGAIEHKPIDQAISANRQILARARLIDVREQRRNPRVAGPVHRPRSDAGTFQVVVVFDFGKTGGNAACVKSSLNGDQLSITVARDWDWAVSTMMRSEPVKVRLQALEVRRHVRKTPIRVAESDPRIEIARPSPQCCRSVDCGGPADHLATLIRHGAAFDRNGFVAPIVREPCDVFRVEQVGRRLRLAFVVRTGFQQEDGRIRPLRQPRCQNCARGTRTDDDVAAHGASPRPPSTRAKY